MRGLTILVAVLSLMILVAMGFVVYGVSKTLKTAPLQAEMAPLILPAGSVIDQMAGFQDYLALHVRTGNSEAIYLVDPKSNTVKTRLPIRHRK